MKSILLFLGIVACYALLSLAASPLDASLTSSEDVPLPGASGRPVVVEPTTLPPIPVEHVRPAASSSTRPSPLAVQQDSGVPQADSTRSAAPTIAERQERPREPGAEPGLSDFEQFAPYIRKHEPPAASASSREYLRDPWVIEDLVLL
jgi:hypothetical protein